MKVYHGSYSAIENIDFLFCRKRRDFGRGFYVTKIRLQAEYWAIRKGDDHDTQGIVTEFEFDDSFFEDKDLKVLRFCDYNENGLDFVVSNRTNNYEKQIHDYDIIEGPVADDDIATRVYDYIKKRVSKKQFLSELSKKEPTHQICFSTMQSLQALELNKNKVDAKTIKIDNDVIKTLMNAYKINEIEATKIYYKSKTYTKLADENSGFYKKHWKDIYEMLKIELRTKS